MGVVEARVLNVEFRYKPMLKQSEFHRAGQKNKLYAGGMGSGKTWALIGEIVRDALDYPGIRMLLGRKTEDELYKTDLAEFETLCPAEILEGGGYRSAHDANKREIRFYNGSILYYMPLDPSKGALDKAGKGITLGKIILDELTELDESLFIMLHSRLRQPGMPNDIVAATNPNGHDWVWKLFVNEGRDKETFFSVISKTEDNPYLPDGYVENMRKTMPDSWYRRYVDASFDDFSGLVYPEFMIKSRNIGDIAHVVDGIDYGGIIYRDINVLEARLGVKGLRFRSIDYGWANPTVCLWVWVFPRVLCSNRKGWDSRAGEVYVYREYRLDRQVVSYHSQMIDSLSVGENSELTLIDPSCYNTQRDGKNVAMEFADNGLNVTPANHELVAGLNRVRERLRPSQINGRPSLYVFADCTHTIDEFGRYHLRDLKPGDTRNAPEEPVKKDDHCMDALRYAIIWLFEHRERIYDFSDERELTRRARNKILELPENIDYGLWPEIFDDEDDDETEL